MAALSAIGERFRALIAYQLAGITGLRKAEDAAEGRKD